MNIASKFQSIGSTLSHGLGGAAKTAEKALANPLVATAVSTGVATLGNVAAAKLSGRLSPAATEGIRSMGHVFANALAHRATPRFESTTAQAPTESANTPSVAAARNEAPVPAPRLSLQRQREALQQTAQEPPVDSKPAFGLVEGASMEFPVTGNLRLNLGNPVAAAVA